MKTPKITKKDIYVLLLGIFLATLITPLLNGFYQIIINWFVSISSLFEVFYYRSLATNVSFSTVYYAYTVMFLLLIYGVLYIYIIAIFRAIYYKKQNDNTEEVEHKIKSNIKNEKIFDNRFILIIILAVFTYLVLIYQDDIEKENNTFDNNIDMIAPYVDNQKILELKSDWVRMTSKEDYSEIQNDIEKIRKEYNLLDNK